MSKSSARATKSKEVVAAVEAVTRPIVTNAVQSGNELLTAPTKPLDTYVKGAEKGHAALQSIAVGAVLGTFTTEQLDAIAWPAALKNNRTYVKTVCAYVTKHGAPALCALWNGRQSERSRVVSLSGLASAIKDADKAVLTKGADTSEAGEKEPKGADLSRDAAPDYAAVIGSVADILSSTVSNEKKLSMIAALAPIKAARDAIKANEEAEKRAA